MTREEILTKLGWTSVQIRAFCDGILPTKLDDLCFIHCFTPELRPQIETALADGRMTVDAWHEVSNQPSCIPGNELHRFVFDRILALLETTFDIVEEICGHRIEGDSETAWEQRALLKAVAHAESLFDWVYLRYYGGHTDVADRAEREIRSRCPTSAGWEGFLAIIKEWNIEEAIELEVIALKSVGRHEEAAEVEGFLEPESVPPPATPSDDGAGLALLRRITEFLPRPENPDAQALFLELQKKVRLACDYRSLREEREAAILWVAECDLPYAAFFALAKAMRLPRTRQEHFFASFSIDTPVADAILARLVDTVRTVDDCLSALTFFQGNLVLERKLYAIARSLEDWTRVWGAGEYSLELQRLALVNALEFADDTTPAC